MVLSSKDYYKEFNTRYKSQLIKLDDDIYSANINIDIRVKSLSGYTNYLYQYYGLTLKQLLEINSKSLCKLVGSINLDKVPIRDKSYLSVLQAAADGLIVAKQQLELAIRSRNIVLKYNITYNVYKDITHTYNNYVVKELLQGRSVYLGNGFGNLIIKQIKGKPKEEVNSINWKESMKVKQEILARGGIPFVKKDSINNPDYKGEQWCTKVDKDYYPFICWRGRNPKCYLGYYNFDPTRDNNTSLNMEELLANTHSLKEVNDLNIGIVKKLSLYLSINPKHIANYTKHI